MTKMAYNKIIAGIDMPSRIAALPITDKGFPQLWFAALGDDGKPDIRIGDPEKMVRAWKYNKCWICGQAMGRARSFVVGPMCIINRISAEPPCHPDCAEYAVKACPFLARPAARRNETHLPYGAGEPGGIMIKANPGISCLWTTREASIEPVGQDGVIFSFGAPVKWSWWTEARLADQSEIDRATLMGADRLFKIADGGPEPDIDRASIQKAVDRARPYFRQMEGIAND